MTLQYENEPPRKTSDGGKQPVEKSFGVAPSPFNAVKLELGVLIVLNLSLLAMLNSIIQDGFIQIALLLMAGIAGMVWIIWRTHKILKEQHRKATPGSHPDHPL